MKNKDSIKITPSPRIDYCGVCKKEHGYDCPKEKSERQRTLRQNKALHLYCTKVAEELNDAGIDMSAFVNITQIDHTMESVKMAARAIAKAKYGKESTADLTTKELIDVCEELNRHIAQFGLHIPFPSTENDLASLEQYNS